MLLNFFPKEKHVGIDIGHTSIKFAQVEPFQNGLLINALHSIPTPPDAIAEGVVTNPQAVGEAIRQGIKEARISATSANLAVAGPTVVARTVKMPKMPEQALRKSIRFEAGRYVPSSVEESYLDCQIIREIEDNQTEVLVVAAPRDIVETRINAVQHAGLETDAVELEAFALYRTLVEFDAGFENETTIAIIDIGGENTDVSIVDKGAFALTRSIPIAGKQLTRALENYFKLSNEEAEKGKQTISFDSLVDNTGPMENPPLRIIQPLVDELIREIRRSLNYYHSQLPGQSANKSVNQILLTGGTSLMKGLGNYISNRLGIPVLSPNFLDNPRFRVSTFEPNDSPKMLAVAVGLAMRAHEKLLVAA